MIREFNIENNELVTVEGSPLIEITHFNDENKDTIKSVSRVKGCAQIM